MNMNHRTHPILVCAVVCLLGAAGCEEKSAPSAADWPEVPNDASSPSPALPPAAPPTAPPASPQRSVGDGVELAGILWNVPPQWTSVGASGMRIAEYSVTAEAGVASIRFFSTQGSAEANVERWKGQVKDPTDGPNTKTMTSGGLTAHVVTITGTYSGMGPSGAANPPAAGTRMLGAFVEGGPRPVQVLVTGPDEVVRSIEPAWEAMLRSIRVQ